MNFTGKLGAELLAVSAAAVPQELSGAMIRITDTFDEPVPLLCCGERLMLSRGNIMSLIGKPKACKTFLTSAMAASIECDCLGIEAGDTAKSVLLIDTEQAATHVHKVLRRIYRLTGWDMSAENHNMNILSLREYDAAERQRLSLLAIETWKPDIVIIDGLRDLVKDFNNIDESSAIVGKLMEYSTKFQCGIVSVLHQNKADTNARGHLGTELMNKSETVLQLTNNSGIIEVAPVYSRNREIDVFNFRINEQGLPELCNASKSVVKVENLRKEITLAMFGSSWIARADLVQRLEKQIGKGSRTCQRRINEAIESNVLTINESGMLVLQVSSPEEPIIPF